MTRKTTTLLARTAGFFTILGAARNAAAAVEVHRTPAVRDLDILGIDPAAFRSMNG